MRRVGELNFKKSPYVPGQAIFSERISKVLSGEQTAYNAVPITSAFGTLHRILTRFPRQRWSADLFPDLRDIYSGYAEAIGNRRHPPIEWGRVPLSLPARHHPTLPPLRASFELRQAAPRDGAADPMYAEKLSSAALLALIKALNAVRGAIEDRVALVLAFETLNGMAKTGPFLDEQAAEVIAKLKASSG
ncbi:MULTISPECIES: hypothetical protein [unclassified Bradyrhizobium]|uniref:hypothetical protein n=1 Tax=unclassified Bradyrhizobium TaxID=2631580 RepID=UPI002916783A|nr:MULTISPECIES: hypothetical protein [unclassified Bradyrhizobium]